MALTAVAVAGVAATAAGAAYQASQAGKGAPGAGGSYVGPGLAEMLFNRGTRDILDSERSILDDALAQGKFVEPEMYRALGLEPVYDRPADEASADYEARSTALREAQDKFNDLRLQAADINTKMVELRRSKPGKGLKGKEKKAAQRGKRQQLRALEKSRKEIVTGGAQAEKEALIQGRALEQSGAVGRRVVGFKPIEGVYDPTGSAGGSYGGALDQFNQHLNAALRGEEPIDPTLKTSFEERERNLRERLRRQLGPDYETTTAGSDALANFDREKSEAFAQYNRQSIEGYASLSQGRAESLSGLTGKRLQQLAFPSTLRAELAQTLGPLAGERRLYSAQQQSERGMKIGQMERAAAARAAASAERSKAIAGLIGSVGTALSGSAGGFGGSAGALATPSTVNVPSYGEQDGGGGFTGATGYSGYGGKLA